jgi:hypothetical protein
LGRISCLTLEMERFDSQQIRRFKLLDLRQNWAGTDIDSDGIPAVSLLDQKTGAGVPLTEENEREANGGSDRQWCSFGVWHLFSRYPLNAV